jgi:LuxR family transcriptional regulator, activator of conjugal transfer of Ti plasmids
MDKIFEQFVQNLSMHDNASEIERLLRRTLDQYGFPCFAYLSFAPRGDDDDTLAITTYPSSWVEQYCANRYDRIDPVISRSIATTLPFAWSADRSDLKLTKKQKWLLEQASEFGIQHGFTIPIHDRQGKVATLTLADGDSRSAFDARAEQCRHQLHLIAIYLHAQLRNVTPVPISPLRPCLTQRERACLQWGSSRKERFGYRGNYKHQSANGGLSHRERQAQARSGDGATGGRQGTDVRHHQHLAARSVCALTCVQPRGA